MTELQDWKNAVEMMRCNIVVPNRSVDRIRRAIAEGRDAEPYLRDIEEGLGGAFEIAREMDDRPKSCPHCLGTGHVLEESR